MAGMVTWVLVSFLLLVVCCREAARRKYRRLWWYGGLLLFDVILAAGEMVHNRAAEAVLVWNGAAFAALLGGMVVWLVTPRSER